MVEVDRNLAVLAAAALVAGCVLHLSAPRSISSDAGRTTFEAPPDCADSNPPRTRLLFLSNRPGGGADDNYDLYEASLDGSSAARITDFPDYSIRWFDRDRASGRLVIAASSDGDLTVGPSGHHGGAKNGEQVIAILGDGPDLQFLIDIRPGGTNPEEFVGVWHPTFSPDGQRVVYSGTQRGQSANLWIQNADGTGLLRLIDDPHRTYQDPRFTPDGRIVFVRHDRQGLGQLMDANGLDIWILDPDDPASARPITDEESIPGSSRVETDPAMSPDCSWVASIRATQPIGLATLLRPASDNVLFPVNLDGRQPMRVLQQGANPLRVHGVPTWIDAETLLSYRWESLAGGWRIIRYRIDSPDGEVVVLDLGAPKGAEDLLPLAY